MRVSDNVDANLSVIAQTFIDACTTAEHKVGRVCLLSVYMPDPGVRVCVYVSVP